MNKLGFGLLRLPEKDGQVDHELLCQLVDAYIAGGGRYFDTAYTYGEGASEEAIRKALVERYPRDAYLLADKLPGYRVKAYEDCQTYFQESCRRCGVDCFDVYLLHALNRKYYARALLYREFDFLRELKSSGRAKRIGFSFHDTPELLDQILTEQPEVDCVLLQINYLDWDSESVQSRKCYETALRHGKTVLVMEPVKGGMLAAVPAEAEVLLQQIDAHASPASHAIRFAQSLPGVEVVLSGMNAMAQVQDNLKDIEPMTAQEMDILKQVVKVLNSRIAVACTGCAYCVSHCPQNICIPDYFRLYNEYARNEEDGWRAKPAYAQLGQTHGKASDCVGCGVCEESCPQKLPIREYLVSIKEKLE